jgi:amyloid beta A4 precursor protein-binding family B protein 1-interacting protein
MANLEDTQEAELDAILGELSLLEQKGDLRGRCHSINSSNSTVSTVTMQPITTTITPPGNGNPTEITSDLREPRTESPDNDSAFSDTVSLLSSESSASSGVSSGIGKTLTPPQSTVNVPQVIQILFINDLP